MEKFHISLLSTVDKGEWVASGSANFTPRERPLITHWIKGLLKTISGLDQMTERKIPASAKNQTLFSQLPWLS